MRTSFITATLPLACAALACAALACAASPPTPLELASPALRELPTVVTSQSPLPAVAPADDRASCVTTPTELGRIQSPELTEISGIAESLSNPGVFFVHNDSGDSPRFFAIARDGQTLAEVSLPSVQLVLDVEDIAVGPAPAGKHYVYLGDTGNNFARNGRGLPRRTAVLYRIPEPLIARGVSAHSTSLSISKEDVAPIVLSFPDRPHDVEAFFIDPVGGDLFVVTKEDTGPSLVLTANAAALQAGQATLEQVGLLQFGVEPLPGNGQATAASISSDGSAILIRTYSSVFLFPRRAGEPIIAALGRAPRSLPSPVLRQGEAVSFTEGGAAFVTVSEGQLPAIWCVRL